MALGAVFCATVLIAAAVTVEGYSSGAPPSACKGLQPKHGGGIGAQNGVAPFDYAVNPNTVKLGQNVTVILRKQASGPAFQGFLIQGRPAGGSQPAGRFFPAGAMKAVNCGSDFDSVTHTSKEDKDEIQVNWQAPAPGKYEVMMTVLEQYDRFYQPIPLKVTVT